MADKRPKLPLILTANEVVDGHVVYFDGEGWSPRMADALVARDDAAAERLEGQLAADIRTVEPFLATVAIDAAGKPLPTHYRERIRVTGPTFEREHGPETASAGAA